MSRVSAASLLVLASRRDAGLCRQHPEGAARPRARPAPAPRSRRSRRRARPEARASVCGAYRRQLRVVQLRQQTASGQAVADELKAKELSLNAIIADACE